MSSNLKQWSIKIQSNGCLELTHSNGFALADARPEVLMSGNSTQQQWQLVDSTIDFHRTTLTYRQGQELSMEVRITEDPDGWLHLSSRIENTTKTAVPLDIVSPLVSPTIQSAPDLQLIYRHGMDMTDLTCLHPLGNSFISQACLGLTTSNGTQAVVFGFEDHSESFNDIQIQSDQENILAIQARCNREGIPLLPLEQLHLPDLLIGCQESLFDCLTRYAQKVGAKMGTRVGPVRTGWCSWYTYYGSETENDIFEDLASITRSTLKDHIDVIQIDDGWSIPTEGHPRVWGDWYPGYKFPHGMKILAEKIKKHGFTPGLWLAPFSVDPASTFAREHPDLLVHDDSGPSDFWGAHGLDLSHPKALDFLTETFTRVFDEWGFDYVKIDFLGHAIQPGKRHDPTKTTAQIFREGMSRIRQAAGDRFILNCGSPIAPAIGLCDGMRIGMDVSSRWFVPMNLTHWPLGNCNILSAVNQTFYRQWMHKIWWQNDPDCLVVRDYGSEGEKKTFVEGLDGAFATNPPYGLSYDEAGFWARMIWMTGTMSLFSERLDELSPERKKLLERVYPPNPHPTRWVDWFQDPDMHVLVSKGDDFIIGVFNRGDTPRNPIIPRTMFSLDSKWSFIEKWSHERFSGSGELVHFPSLSPHSAALWVLED